MSGISLSSFLHTAQRAEGTVRIAKGTSDELVNKGTIGNRLATFFRNVGEAIGLVRPNQPERAQRQQQAVAAFQQALTDHYGDAVANKVMARTGLDQATVLTSDLIRQTNQEARLEIQQNRQQNLQDTQRFAPPQAGASPSADFTRIAQSLNVNPDSLSAMAKTVFTERLTSAMDAKSEQGRIQLAAKDIEDLAKKTLKEVSRLDAAGKLDEAEDARADHAQAMHDVLAAIGQGASPKVLVDRLRAADAALQNVFSTEARANPGLDDIQEVGGAALQKALNSYPAEDRQNLYKAYGRSLEPDGVLRALYVGAQSVVDDMMAEMEDDAIGEDMRAVGAVRSAITAVANGISAAGGSPSGDSDADMARLDDPTGMDGTTLRNAKNALIDLAQEIRSEQSS